MRTGKLLAALGMIVGMAGASLPGAPALADDSNAMRQVGMVRTGTGSFSLDVEGADVRTVVRAIAEFSGRNIVVAPGVHGTVKVSLKNVDWQDALRTVVRLNGLD